MNRGRVARHRVDLEFFLPREELRPFITTYYRMRISGAMDDPVVDYLHPEWTNLRYFPEGSVKAAIGAGDPEPIPALSLTGPTTLTNLFEATDGTSWGIGILPLGWARLTSASASDFSDRISDPAAHPELSVLAGVAPLLRDAQEDAHAVCASLSDHFLDALASAAPREKAILSVQRRLVDPAVHTVAEIAEAAGMSVRTLERFSRDVFGFSPQLLLRRQRFLRSLAQFMLDPSMKWIETLDAHYHDQAHFVRDFKHFMKMTPRQYAALDHPVLSAAAGARMATAGAAMQVLHRPGKPGG
ncbi:helix-turn-helix domain-containing protein [Qipengyuania sp. 1NDH17]|uniref:Helix-turn-helix domain-containing protein n=1 Tax=Qipengyuania polymorpha TaxID=2867234 RepID=A0ABS7J605_9SPHN|nr:helix-turn-helix domain-containing protein [Qipengyuania polymorpha]MBX7458873.1 helix-turn-helix domain-containing protein [Qipengyuania polymorpha]